MHKNKYVNVYLVDALNVYKEQCYRYKNKIQQVCR